MASRDLPSLPGTPFLLVGLQRDANDPDDELISERVLETSGVTQEEGQELANTLGAHRFMECSALTQEGVKAVFDEAFLVGLAHSEQAKPKNKSVLSALFSPWKR